MAEVIERPKTREAPAFPVLPPVNTRFSITESGYAFAEIDVTQPVGHTVADAMRPEYWVHHAHKLKARALTGEPDRAGAMIRLRTEDHAHYAQLYVRAVEDRSLIVQQVGQTTYFGQKAEATPGFDVRWNVGNRAYDIIRDSDKTVVASKFKTREDAQGWIKQTRAA